MARRKKSSVSIWHDLKAAHAKYKKWNAKRRKANVKTAKMRREAATDTASARLERDAATAARRRATATKRAEKAAQARARKAAAEARAQQTAPKPQVVKARVVRPVREKTIDPLCKCGAPHSDPAHVTDHLFVMADSQPNAAKKAAPRHEFTARARAIQPGTTTAVLCGARTEDGTPCQNPTLGGPCSAAHTPKGQPARSRA